MHYVFYGDTVPEDFQEQVPFFSENPYVIHIKRFQTADIVPLHYADTVELLVCSGLCGEIVVNTECCPLGGDQVFLIPPYTLHSNRVEPNGGIMYVLKISLPEMQRYVHFENYLRLYGHGLDQLSYRPDAYPAVLDILERLIARDGNLGACIPLFLELARVLSAYPQVRRSENLLQTKFGDSRLQELINWTNRNYSRRITVEEAAALTGYSKYYFCSRFKALTGVTYMRYLTNFRISCACSLLCGGESVQSVSRSTGFENVSHFIQVFRSVQHVTPYRYACQKRAEQPERPV